MNKKQLNATRKTKEANIMNKPKYDATITINKAALTGLLSVVLLAAVDYIQSSTIPVSSDEFRDAWPVMLGGLAAAVYAAARNYLKNRDTKPKQPPYRLLTLALCAAIGATLAGCATMGPGAQSRAEVALSETVYDDNGNANRFDMTFLSRGDGDNAQTLRYTGPDWELVVGQDSAITSPSQREFVSALTQIFELAELLRLVSGRGGDGGDGGGAPGDGHDFLEFLRGVTR